MEFTGDAENAPPTQGLSDIIGLVAAFVILMVLFRALVPTVIPLVFAVVAVIGAFLILYLAARFTHFNTITEILVPMIGLGVGIDYTLFIVTRFRQFLHDGLDPQEAAAAAGATAGRAVIFAGTTVAISITGLALIGLDFITKLGIGSALGVLTRCSSRTRFCRLCLPFSVTRSIVADWACRWWTNRAPARVRRRSQRGGGSCLEREDRVAGDQRDPLLLASPVLASRLGLADAGTAPEDQTTRKAYDLLSTGFGRFHRADSDRCRHAGRSKRPNPTRCRAQERAGYRSSQPADLQRAESIQGFGRDHQHLLQICTSGPYRRHRIDPAPYPDPCDLGGSNAHAYVSGPNAAFTDIGHQIFSRAPWFLLYIIGITFLVLAMAFRSAVIAVKAALTTLVSALVGFGALTFVVQLGHGMGLIGLDRTGPIESFVPPIAFAILFGLSIDYEVFLMSRVREEHVHGSDTVAAVKDGIAGVGRVIVAAALIMSSVFFSFLLSPDRVSKNSACCSGLTPATHF